MATPSSLNDSNNFRAKEAPYENSKGSTLLSGKGDLSNDRSQMHQGEPYRLEIDIVDVTDKYQEIEIFYGGKRRRKKITKFLPRNLASNFFTSEHIKIESHIKQQSKQFYSPSTNVGALKISNLNKYSQKIEQPFLQEKLMRALSKINQMRKKSFGYEKIWDGSQRVEIDSDFVNLSVQEKENLRAQESQRRIGDLSTVEKAILLAISNRSKPEDKKIDRIVVSSKFNEISNKDAFKSFIDEILDITRDRSKLVKALFGAQQNNFSSKKREDISNYLGNIIDEEDDSKRKSQLRFLGQVVDSSASSQKGL